MQNEQSGYFAFEIRFSNKYPDLARSLSNMGTGAYLPRDKEFQGSTPLTVAYKI